MPWLGTQQKFVLKASNNQLRQVESYVSFVWLVIRCMQPCQHFS